MAHGSVPSLPCGGTAPPFSVGAARTIRRRQAQATVNGKLEAAYGRVQVLEERVACLNGIIGALQHILADDAGSELADDLTARLTIVAPVFVARRRAAVQNKRAAIPTTVRVRRNVAEHEYGIPGGDIAAASRADLQTLQRGGAADDGGIMPWMRPHALPAQLRIAAARAELWQPLPEMPRAPLAVDLEELRARLAYATFEANPVPTPASSGGPAAWDEIAVNTERLLANLVEQAQP